MDGPAKRGEIHLGDLARALASLHWQGDGQASAIAACLGFGIRPAPALKPPKEIYDRRDPGQALPPQAPAPRRPVYVPPTPKPPPALPAQTLPSHLQALDERVPPAPDIDLDGETALFNEEAGQPSTVARQSLFPEKTNRHILAAALATRRDGREIDVAKLVAALCRRVHINHLPRRAEPTLGRGCQLLLDYSPGMVPFWEDLNDLIGQVCDVVGPANTRVYSFDTRPTEAVCWTPAGRREAWKPDGVPVLAATDFGIQGPSARAAPDPAWAEAIAHCAKAGSPLLILIPWPEPRWPKSLGPTPALVHWSPHTTAAMLRQKLGIGHHAG